MNSHMFRYRLRVLLRDKEMVFWTILFPILLATLFSIAFANIETGGSLLPIPAAVVSPSEDSALDEVLTQVSKGDDPLLKVHRVELSTARELLRDGEVAGIILPGDPVSLEVASSGLGQSVLRSFLDQYVQAQAGINRIARENPDALPGAVRALGVVMDFTQEQVPGRAPLNLLMVFYFALLAMSSFYGGYYGLAEALDIQANLSSRGARVSLAPVHKLSGLLSSAGASLVIHFLTQLLLLAYLRIVLGVDFGTQLVLVIPTTLMGSVLSISLGAFIGSALPWGENIKNGVITAVSMIGSLLAGLMFPGLKHLVYQHAPLAAKLNPVGLLADAYYALYYFPNLERYYQNLGLLAVYALIFILGSYLFLRRRSYDSI